MFLTRPIALTFFVLSIIALLFPLFKKKNKTKYNKKKRQTKRSTNE
jgi:TctA family transporter